MTFRHGLLSGQARGTGRTRRKVEGVSQYSSLTCPGFSSIFHANNHKPSFAISFCEFLDFFYLREVSEYRLDFFGVLESELLQKGENLPGLVKCSFTIENVGVPVLFIALSQRFSLSTKPMMKHPPFLRTRLTSLKEVRISSRKQMVVTMRTKSNCSL